MQSDAPDLTLHEGMIASEFGVSRTPIRQVLQRLAYERLVETRSGVGTIVSPLRTDQRESDLIVLKALFAAAGTCSGDRLLPMETMDRLVAALAVSERASRDAEGYLRVRTELLDITAGTAPDAILGDAMRAAHWRHIRWRMADHAWAEDEVFEGLIDTIKTCAAAARNGGLAGFYACLSEAAL